MEWIFAAVVLALCVFSASFRKIAIVLAVLGGIGYGSYLLYEKRVESLRHAAIPPSQLVLTELRMSGSRWSPFMYGRMVNKSKTNAADAVTIQFQLQECTEGSPEACVLVEDEAIRVNIFIPAGQARDFSVRIPFELRSQAGKKFTLIHRVQRVRAELE